jgi:hypothetical protein
MKIFHKNIANVFVIFGFLFCVTFSGYFFITKANASIVENIKSLFFGNTEEVKEMIKVDDNLLKSNISYFSENISTDSSKISYSTSALDSSINSLSIDENNNFNVQSGSMRLSNEEEVIVNDTINVYEVKSGDTLDSISNIFNVSKNNIIYANDLKGKTIKAGDTILIYPINGIQYVVKNSSTINEIAKKYKIDATDIATYNGISIDAKLAKGDTIFIPDVEGEISEIVNLKVATSKPKTKYSNSIVAGYFMKPVVGCVKTQGVHGHNGVDLGCRVGTPLLASANGKVIKASTGGYNGGYGGVIFISHPNGTQTVYGHLSRINVSVGDSVVQGQVIGATGNSGRSTGPHLHFEVRGASNPF